MKKAKIMLTAITVLAIVGGALAFKARTFNTTYCTSIPVNGHPAGVCANFHQTFVSGATRLLYYTTAPNAACTIGAGVIVPCLTTSAAITVE